MGWGRVKNGTDAGWKPEKPKPRESWNCPKCPRLTRSAHLLNCPRHPDQRRPY